VEIYSYTSESLLWVGNNPTGLTMPLIIHLKLNNVTGSIINIDMLTHPLFSDHYSIRALNIESVMKFKALV
jgi:hypothetical protein